MANKVVDRIKFEIEQVDQLLETYADLLTKVQHTPPDLVEVTAVASVLHSFYNGLENIFLTIAKAVDTNVPVGNQWHRDLLKQMTEPTSDRVPVLTTELARGLADYLGFRHFYRHSYSFSLDWRELEKLVTPLTEVWTQVKSELEAFVKSLDV